MILQQVARGGRAANVFQAQCSLAESVGDIVFVAGPPILGLYQVRKVNIDDSNKRTVWGMITKITGTNCVVQTTGIVKDVYFGLTPGKKLFVDTNARATEVVPAYPTMGKRLIHKVGVVLATNELSLDFQSMALIIP